MIKVLVTLVLVAAVHNVSGLPGGAPRGACISLTPSHRGNLPQNFPSPHIVDLSSFDSMFNESTNTTTLYYTPGTTYSITLVATGIGMFSNIYRGFLLQGRAYADDSVVGTFMAPSPGDLYRLSDCERSNGAVTHNSRDAKTNITVYWTAPTNGTGPIYFGHSFVWSFDTFWANLQTEPILEEGGINEPPNPEVTPTPIAATATPPVVMPTPPVVTATPPVVMPTPPVVMPTPPVVIANPTEMPPAATPNPGEEDTNVAGGSAGLKIGAFMVSLVAALTLFN